MPDFTGADAFTTTLQEQWQKDRKQKAERKKARAEARLLNEPPTKKNKKAAKRARQNGFLDDGGDDSDDDGPVRRKGNGKDKDMSPVGAKFDAIMIDATIRNFVFDVSQTSMALPPMSKRERMITHLLATAYSLKSTSKGGGAKRFTTLDRTPRTGANAKSDQDVERILRAAGLGDMRKGVAGRASTR